MDEVISQRQNVIWFADNTKSGKEGPIWLKEIKPLIQTHCKEVPLVPGKKLSRVQDDRTMEVTLQMHNALEKKLEECWTMFRITYSKQ